MENEKMERLTKGRFKKSANSKNNSTILGTSTIRNKSVSIFGPMVGKALSGLKLKD